MLSHAHLDHCGRLPLLVKRGFRGPVYAQEATCELTAILLADAAYLAERDAELRLCHAHGDGGGVGKTEPGVGKIGHARRVMRSTYDARISAFKQLGQLHEHIISQKS